jgi:S1-C subfamily serine protease
MKASQLDRTADLAVRMADGSQYTARWVAERKANDLALLQIEREQTDPLPVAVFADIALPPVGSFLISAGPSGAAIGLGTVGVAPRPVAEFGVLGIQIFDSERGPTIGTVLPDSGASDAGIQEKDIVESLDGTPYESADALRAALGALYPGDRVTLAVRRGEERLELTAELRDRWQLFVGDRAELMVNGPTNGRSSGFEQALQHDTVLETNQCGGPVVDSEGRIIGMNIARAGRVASYALPAALVQRDVQAMIGETLDTQPTADRAGPTIASQDAAETVPTPAAQ